MTFSLYSRLETALGELTALQAYATQVVQEGRIDRFRAGGLTGRLNLGEQHQQALQSLERLGDFLDPSDLRTVSYVPEQALRLRPLLEQALEENRSGYLEDMDVLHRIVRGQAREPSHPEEIPAWARAIRFEFSLEGEASDILAEGRRIAEGVERLLGGDAPSDHVNTSMNVSGPTTLGSGMGADLVFSDRGVAPLQVSLIFQYQRHWIRDEGSTQTYVDGTRLPPHILWPLERSHQVRLTRRGESFRLDLPAPPPLEETALLGEFFVLRDQELPGFDDDLAFTVFESLSQAIQGTTIPAALASVLATSPLVHGPLWAGAIRRKLPDLPRVLGIQGRIKEFQRS